MYKHQNLQFISTVCERRGKLKVAVALPNQAPRKKYIDWKKEALVASPKACSHQNSVTPAEKESPPPQWLTE